MEKRTIIEVSKLRIASDRIIVFSFKLFIDALDFFNLLKSECGDSLLDKSNIYFKLKDDRKIPFLKYKGDKLSFISKNYLRDYGSLYLLRLGNGYTGVSGFLNILNIVTKLESEGYIKILEYEKN